MKEMRRHYYKELRLRQMRALVEISRHGSFAEAARRLGLSNPSVWQQVRALEREFEADLVKIHGNEVRLTREGELLTTLAMPLIENFDRIRAVFAERRGQLERSLTLVTTTALLTHELPPVIARYRRAHRDVELTLIDRPSLESRALFERGDADIAIVGSTDCEKLPPNALSEELTRFSFHLIGPPGHPLLAKRKLKLEDFSLQDVILAGPGAAVSGIVPQVFKENGIPGPRVVLTSTNLALTLGYVQMGYGVALVPLPSSVVRGWEPSRQAGLAIRDVSDRFGKERILMFHPAGLHELKHVRQFREMVVEGLRPAE
jgi:molybdate transport repressor ModE-like protein